MKTITTPEAMRKIAQGEPCEFTLRNGDTVRVLDKPNAGRVKVLHNSDIKEYILRDLRGLFDSVGFADDTLYSPLNHVTEPDNVTDVLGLGRYALSVTQDVLSPAGVRAIEKYLAENGIDHTLLDWRLHHAGASLVERIKRLAAQQTNGMSDYAAEQLSDMVAKYTVHAGEYWYDIVDKIDWQSGDYGDSGSCYWGCRNAARELLTDAGGLALRFYDADWENGYGRVWVWPTDDGALVLFNAYGQIMPGKHNSLHASAALLSHVCGTRYGRRISVNNNGSDTGTMWINNGNGFTVGYHKHNHCDLGIDDNGSCTCENCGDRISEDDATFTDYGDGPYCEYCFSELYAHCGHCGCDFDRDEAEELTYRYRGSMRWGATVCPSCFTGLGGAHCDNCGNVVSTEYDEYTSTNDGDVYCECCAERLLTRCDHCEEYSLTDDCIRVHCATGNTLALCSDCDNNGYVICEQCGDISTDTTCQCQLAEDNQLAFSYVMVEPQYAVYPGLLD